MKLYCLRHGETNYNRLGLCNDQPGREVHLTTAGIRQAEAVARKLRGVPLERIFISQLPRTRETADIINRHHGVPLQTHPALNDIRSGFDGRPVAEYFAATGHDRLHARANGGESLLDYRERVTGFLEWLRGRSEKTVLIVAHEETLRVLRAHFEDLPDRAMLDLAFANCTLLEFVL
jgi:alpha-ribazole phosphatase